MNTLITFIQVMKFIFSLSYSCKKYLFGFFLGAISLSININIKPYFIRMLIDSATANIVNITIAYIVIQTCIILMNTLASWCFTNYLAEIRAKIILFFSDKIYHSSSNFLEKQLSGSLVSKAADVFNSISGVIFMINYQFIHFIFVTIIAIVLLCNVHLFLGIGILLFILLFLLVSVLRIIHSQPLAISYAESKAYVWGGVSDYLNNIVNVKLFARLSFENQRLNVSTQDFIKKSKIHGYFFIKFYFIQQIFILIYSMLFFALLVYLKNNNTISNGEFAMVAVLNFSIFERLYTLIEQFGDFATNLSLISNAVTTLEHLPEIRDTSNAQQLIVKEGKIVFDKIQFYYPGQNILFQNMSLIIEPGQKIGLVGCSGVGKSTFVNLILRLREITSGSIKIDGQDIHEVTQNSLRENICIIPQNLLLFHRSIIENIRYGNINATDEEVIQAARQANAHNFIVELQQGYNTLVGENGTQLSGGQRQRIAIARAILKNAKIFILDEATSQMDSILEFNIQNSIWELLKNKTVLVIAHRLSTLQHMDRILVFADGKIIEDGTHQELITKNTLYQNLWNIQNDE